MIGTFTLLDCAKRYWLDELGLEETSCRFHHVSTDEVYGTLAKDEPAFTEIKAYEPNSPYSASKAGSDHIARAYHHTYKTSGNNFKLFKQLWTIPTSREINPCSDK